MDPWSGRSGCLRFAWISVVLLLASSLSNPSALAQVTGANLSGTVVDDSGGALPGVTITITNKANGSRQVLVTGGQSGRSAG